MDMFFQSFYSLVSSDVTVTDGPQCQWLKVQFFLGTQGYFNRILPPCQLYLPYSHAFLAGILGPSSACSHAPTVQVFAHILPSPRMASFPHPWPSLARSSPLASVRASVPPGNSLYSLPSCLNPMPFHSCLTDCSQLIFCLT